MSVLDVGCGDLEVVKALALRSYVGVDQSAPALEAAKRKRPDWTFLQAPAADAAVAELVLCFEVLIHQESSAAYLRLIDYLAEKTRSVLLVSGYEEDSDAIRQNPMLFFHEPLSLSLARTRKFKSVTVIGHHTDVVIFRCEARGPTTIAASGYIPQRGELSMDLEHDDDLRIAREEFQRFIRHYDHDAFVSNCKTQSRRLIETVRDGARFITEEAMSALATSKPLLMVRIGDAEANLLRFADHGNAFEMKWVNAVFEMNDRQPLPIEDAQEISRELSELLADADIVGLRPICPIPIGEHLQRLSETIDRGEIRGALGMIGAFTHAERAVKNSEFHHAVLTSAWVHLGLLEHLDRLLDNAASVVVITGRHELKKLFSDKLQSRLTAFLPIPVQASDQDSHERPFHYPVRYREIIEELQTDLRGTLVLVGAGIFGKKYCAVAKQNGGVALDLGSAFDILAGKRTRGVHSEASFIDVNRETWITFDRS